MKRLLFLAALCLAAGAAHAAVTFGASVTNANGTLSTTLNWNAPGASGCTASGHPSWNGAKPASGTQALPPITLSGTYQLTLSCTTPGNAATTVSWTLPTQNTDNTPLTNLAGVKVYYGRSAGALTTVKDSPTPTATSVSLGNLANGDWFFAATAYNAVGAESDMSNVTSKTVTATAVENAGVTLTVNPLPKAPVLTGVQ